MDLPGSYIVVDLETTGLNPWKDRVIEIGVYRVDGNSGPPEAVLVLQPKDTLLPRDIISITGITDEDLRMGVPPEVALEWLMDKVGDLPLVGHNIYEFDRLFLLAEARRHGVEPLAKVMRDEGRFFDTMAMYKARVTGLRPIEGETRLVFYRRVLEARFYGARYTLTKACEEMGVWTQDVRLHRALGDVTLAQRLFEALRQLTG